MKFQIVIDNDDEHEHRKHHKHRRHPFLYGNFYDENGPFLREHGLEHLSGNFFCQKDALAFIQEALDSGKISLEEACTLGRDETLLLLPEERPAGLAPFQKNEKVRVEKLVTSKGEKNVASMVVADSNVVLHALNSFLRKILGVWTLLFFKKTPREIAKEQMRDIKRKAKKASRKND